MKKYLLIGMAILITACSSEFPSRGIEAITDRATKSTVVLVEPLENSLLLEWGSDNMDSGDRDYETLFHSPLAVDPNNKKVKRGDVVYFKSHELQ